jgi:hypothetical protein
MQPQHFPYARFKQFQAEKEAALLSFLRSSAPLEEVPVVVQPPIDIWGNVSSDRVLSLERQLEAFMVAMQLRSDFAFTYLEPWHGVGVYANIFGCKINWNDFDAPQTLPIYHSIDEVAGLQHPDIHKAELPQMILETIGYYRSVTNDQIDIVLTDTQSPNDSASLILDTSEFFACSLSDMPRLAPFMDLLTQVMIEFSEMQLAAMGPTAAYPGHIMLSSSRLPGISVSDDNMAVISRRAYENAALPYNNRLGAHFGGIALHTCGDFSQNFAPLKRVENLMLVDCALGGVDPTPNNPRKLAEAFAGSGIPLKVRIGAGPEYWQGLPELLRPDLKLILQIASDGDINQSNKLYQELKATCRSILKQKKSSNQES